MNPKILVSLEDIPLEYLDEIVPSCKRLSTLKEIENMPGQVEKIKVRFNPKPYGLDNLTYEIRFKYKSTGVINHEYTQEEVNTLSL